MNKKTKIYIAGHTGLIGSTLLKKLREYGYFNLVFAESSDLDLTNRDAVHKFFQKNHPEYVFFVAAARGGGGRIQQIPSRVF